MAWQVAIDEVKQDRVYPFKQEITADNLLKFAVRHRVHANRMLAILQGTAVMLRGASRWNLTDPSVSAQYNLR